MTFQALVDAAIRSQSLLLPLVVSAAVGVTAYFQASRVRDLLLGLWERIRSRFGPRPTFDYLERGAEGLAVYSLISTIRFPEPTWWDRAYRFIAGLSPLKIVTGVIILAGIFTAGSYFFGFKYVDPAAALALPGPECREPRPKATAAIVFIHGWNGAGDTTWEKFPQLACNDPNLTWAQIYVVNYPTFMLRRNLPIASLARWLEQSFFSAKIDNRFKDVYIVAHSMGGLIARRIFLMDRLRNTSSPIRAIISIASPYQGAPIGSLASALGISRRLTADMDPQSSFLSQLRDDWNEPPKRPISFCFASAQDGIVSDWSAFSQCDCTTEYPQWGHIDTVKPLDRNDERYRDPIRALIQVLKSAHFEPARSVCF